MRIVAEGAISSPGQLTFRAVVPPHGPWRSSVLVTPVIDGAETRTSFPLERPVEQAGPSVRTTEWRASGPRIRAGDESPALTLRRSGHDLGALRIFDPERPDTPVVAAGAPWFMAPGNHRGRVRGGVPQGIAATTTAPAAPVPAPGREDMLPVA